MADRVRIPIVLLTGFLGSGKTTLLARWLRSPHFAGAMVIVNELGEVGLDHALLETASEAPLLLENGCACCAASDDLIATLERLFWDRLQRRIPRFERVVIETTGIADPAPIIDMLHEHPFIAERFKIGGVVTAFDAVRGGQRLREFPECRRQLELATVVVITKADLVSDAGIEAARDVVARSAPGSLLLTSRQGDLAAARIMQAIGGEASPSPGRAMCSEGHVDCEGNHEEHGDEHGHHLEGITTAFLELDGPVSWAVMLEVLPEIIDANEASLLRLKGSVVLSETGGYYAIQAMAGEPISRTPMPVGPGALNYRTGLTIIARGKAAALIADEISQRLSARSDCRDVREAACDRGG